MQVIKCDQGGETWHLARAGAITASMFCEVRKVVGGLTEQQQLYVDALLAGKSEDEAKDIAKYKTKPRRTESVQKALDGERVGDYSEAAKNYAFRLAVERLSGEPLNEGFSTWAMERGNELEPEARACHEEKHGVLVQQTGFVKSDCGFYGASADGLIGDDGGSEYKCLVDPSRMRSILIDKEIDEFVDQVQGCMWITGRQWWHFCLYCPSLKNIDKELWVMKVQRDDAYIEQLEEDLFRFNQLVDDSMLELMSAELPMSEAA